MNIQIQAQDFPLTAELQEHVQRRIAYALNHGRDLVARIIVRLTDVNGPRGGKDKRCSIELRLKGAPTLTIEDTEADLTIAIDRAIERAGRTLDRRLARRREIPAVSLRQVPLAQENA